MQKGLRGVIFGATGAVGRTLVKLLIESDRWSNVRCVVRKQPEEWKALKTNGKLDVQEEPDMDRLLKPEEWKLQGFDAIFVCFGSQVKHGEETFTKVDKTYPLMAAEVAIKNKIPHYILVSSSGGDPSSSFLYMRTKGELERDLKLKNLNRLSILKPGLIKNRPDARTGEKIAQFFSFIPFPQIDVLELGTVMMGLAEVHSEEAPKQESVIKVYQNKDLVAFLNEYRKK